MFCVGPAVLLPMSGLESLGGVGGKDGKRECDDTDVTEGSVDATVRGADGEWCERDFEKGEIQPEWAA